MPTNAANANANATLSQTDLAVTLNQAHVASDVMAPPHEKKTGGMSKGYRKLELVLPDGRRAWLSVELEVKKAAAPKDVGPKVRRVALAASSPSPSAPSPVATPVPTVDMLAKMTAAMEALTAKVLAMESSAAKK